MCSNIGTFLQDKCAGFYSSCLPCGCLEVWIPDIASKSGIYPWIFDNDLETIVATNIGSVLRAIFTKASRRYGVNTSFVCRGYFICFGYLDSWTCHSVCLPDSFVYKLSCWSNVLEVCICTCKGSNHSYLRGCLEDCNIVTILSLAAALELSSDWGSGTRLGGIWVEFSRVVVVECNDILWEN